MNRVLRTLALAGVLVWVLSASAAAQMFVPPAADNAPGTPSPAEAKVDPSTIHAPWDVAPPEQIVAGRDPMSFRKEGTLLARATREIPRVSESDLLQRKYAMYSGRRFYSSPHLSPETEPSRQAVVGRVLASESQEDAQGRLLGWIGWSLAGCVVVTALVGWRRGWFVPFSARGIRTSHASQAASPQAQSHAVEKPLFELVNRKQ